MGSGDGGGGGRGGRGNGDWVSTSPMNRAIAWEIYALRDRSIRF